jgi:dTDP-4-amino-4,6-dideoxygalactose transaminase
VERAAARRLAPLVEFNRPFTSGREFAYIEEAIRNRHLSGNGPFTERCTNWLERATMTRRALLTHSCTGALEMSALLADLSPGDEVIMPSFTFVSTANAVVLRGAKPVFIDIRGDTLNLDESLVEDAITEKTRAIFAVHYAGVACELDALVEIAQRHALILVEDAAQALLASYRGRPLGSFGDLATVSFHETKTVHCGEGGALLINREHLVERAEVLQEKGTNRTKFFRGAVDKYTWVDVGSSYLLSEVNAAFLWAQIESAERIVDARLDTWNRYHDAFADLEASGRLRRPIVPSHCDHNGQSYFLILDSLDDRSRFIAESEAAGVRPVFHYVPLHSSLGGVTYGRAHGALRCTSSVSDRLVRLPLWAGMSHEDVERVVDVSKRVLGSSTPLIRSA